MPESSTTRDETRRAIVDAAARLLQEHGPVAVTTRGVAEAAGIQAPTIYRIFGDKDGLIEAVAEHVMATYVSEKAAVVEAAARDDVDPVEDLRAGWRAQVDFGLANPALFRLLNDPDRFERSPAAQSGLQVLLARIRRIAASGRLRVTEQRAVGLLHASGMGAILTLLSMPAADRDLGLPEATLDAVLAQILTDQPATTTDPVRSAVIATRAVVDDLGVLSDPERALLVQWLDRVLAEDSSASGGRSAHE